MEIGKVDEGVGVDLYIYVNNVYDDIDGGDVVRKVYVGYELSCLLLIVRYVFVGVVVDVCE